MKNKLILIIFYLFIFYNIGNATGGRTNSFGCHNSKTEGYHCHNSGYSKIIIPKSCPDKVHQYRTSVGKCYCIDGYNWSDLAYKCLKNIKKDDNLNYVEYNNINYKNNVNILKNIIIEKENKYVINGIVNNKNIDKIIVIFNNYSSYFPKDSYILKKYKKGDTFFKYNAFRKYEVLDYGENIYIIKFYSNNLLLYEKEIIIELKKNKINSISNNIGNTNFGINRRNNIKNNNIKNINYDIERLILIIILILGIFFYFLTKLNKKILVYHFNIDEPYKSFLLNGRKTIEGRLFKGRFRKINKGDIFRLDTGEKFKILNVVKYTTFYEMIKNEGIKNVLPDKSDIQEGINDFYYKFSSKRDESLYGVISFKLKFIK